MKRKIFPVLSACVLLCGCAGGSFLDSDFTESEALLSLDKGSVEVEGASFYAGESVSDTLILTSSRSWSLTPQTEVPWLQLSRTAGLNPGKVLKQWPLALSFEDNPLTEPRNLAVSITIDGKSLHLPLQQKAFSPVLTLESPASCAVKDLGGEFFILLRSNSVWTAAIDPSSTASVRLDAEEGVKTDTLRFSVKPNTDVAAEKTARIVISAPGTESVGVDITQDKCVPFLTVDREHSETDVLPVEGNSRIVFDTNENWTATLEEGSSPGVSLSVTEGVPGDPLYVRFPTATIAGDVVANVCIRTKSGLNEAITLIQKACIFISFRKWPDNNGWSSADKTVLLGATSGTYDIPRTQEGEPASTWTEKDAAGNIYVFYVGTADAMFRSESCGLVIGSISQNPAFRIDFPAVEGKALKRVKIMLGNSDVKLKNQESTATGTKGCMVDAEGVVLNGGQTQEVKTYQADADWAATATCPSFYADYTNHAESMYDFILSGTSPGTVYSFSGEYRQVIRWFILYYE